MVMEHLPSDVLWVILRKVAVQQPLSLLRTVEVCKSFQQTAKDRPRLWKEALLGRELTDEDCCRDSQFDAAIRYLGGYEHMVRIEQRNQANHVSENSQATDQPVGPRRLENAESSKDLVVQVRERGGLHLALGLESITLKVRTFIAIATWIYSVPAGPFLQLLRDPDRGTNSLCMRPFQSLVESIFRLHPVSPSDASLHAPVNCGDVYL